MIGNPDRVNAQESLIVNATLLGELDIPPQPIPAPPPEPPKELPRSPEYARMNLDFIKKYKLLSIVAALMDITELIVAVQVVAAVAVGVGVVVAVEAGAVRHHQEEAALHLRGAVGGAILTF